MRGDRDWQLPPLTPDAERAEAVVTRCRRRIERRRRTHDRQIALTVMIEHALVGGFGVLYLLAVAGNALRF
jgi:broad specificity phosphatase PhoE